MERGSLAACAPTSASSCSRSRVHNPKRFTAHSLRAGLATELAEAGIPMQQIANAGRWKRLDTVLDYARRARAMTDAPHRALSY